jgi:hypothetical protein
MNLLFFYFCSVAFVVTVIIDTYKKTRSQEKRS